MFTLNKGSLQIAPLERALNRTAKFPLPMQRQSPVFYPLLYLRSLTGPLNFNVGVLAVWVILWQLGVLGTLGSLIYWGAFLAMPVFVVVDLYRTIESNVKGEKG